MKIKHLTILAISAALSLGSVAVYLGNNITASYAEAADPCAAAADPCAADPCAAAADPCAADPCAAAADPCAADPCAATTVGVVPVIYTDAGAQDNLAIRGFDPVAYFTEGAPVQGSSDYALEWKGAIWQFASEENKQLFANNPEEFAPQYGGYCAFAVAKKGSLVSVDPEAWSIVDNKLYLNFSNDVRSRWLADTSGYITTADSIFPQLLTSATTVTYDTVGEVSFN
ncbi:MAG: YHS domain-containing (seleno)protein [Cyanobacteria bacterium P01_D01_bin.105]